MVESSEKPRVFVRQPLTRAGSKDAGGWGLLARAQAMVIVRTELSESGAFEVAYNSVVTRRPMFFAVHADMPITTTLLQDLEPLCPTAYVTFEDPSELAEPLGRFLARARQASPVSAALLATRLEELRITVVTGLDTADPIVAATASALLTAQELFGLIAENNTGERAGELHHALRTAPALAGGVTNTVRARTDSRRVAAATVCGLTVSTTAASAMSDIGTSPGDTE